MSEVSFESLLAAHPFIASRLPSGVKVGSAQLLAEMSFNALARLFAEHASVTTQSSLNRSAVSTHSITLFTQDGEVVYQMYETRMRQGGGMYDPDPPKPVPGERIETVGEVLSRTTGVSMILIVTYFEQWLQSTIEERVLRVTLVKSLP